MSWDFCIIGGGIAGVSAAARLSHLGSVLLLEAEAHLAHHTSGRSAALYEPNYGLPPVVALSQASGGDLRTIDGGVLGPRGMLLVAGADQDREFAGDCHALGLAPVSVEEARDMVPILNRDTVALAAQATLHVDGRAMTYLTCPRCGGPMARRAFERVSGIVVDECPRHGVWFDAQELEQALAWASSDPGRASWSAPEAPRRSGRSRVDLPLEPRSKPSAVIQVIDFVVDLFVTPW